MQAGVAAVIFDVVLSLGGQVFKGEKAFNAVLLAAAFGLSFFANVNVVYLILAAAVIGVIKALALKKRREAQEKC